jgi:hypothetical protein
MYVESRTFRRKPARAVCRQIDGRRGAARAVAMLRVNFGGMGPRCCKHACLGLLAVFAAGFVADGTARVEARGGPTIAGEDPNSIGVGADLLGRAAGPDGALHFGFSPTFVRAQGNQIFVRGFAEAELRLRESAHVRLRQALGYGSLDLSPVATVSGRGPVQPPAATEFVSIEESTTTLLFDVAGSRRFRLSGSAAWLVNGGADAQARATLPLSRGPLVRGAAEWTATRTDTLRLNLEGFDYRYSNGQRASVAGASFGWQTRIERRIDLAISLGPGIGRTRRGESQGSSTLVYAVGGVDLRSIPARNVRLSVGAGVEPLGDPLSGDLIERGSLRASLNWDRPRGIAFAAQIVGSMALTSGSGGPTSPQAGDRYLQAEVGATMPLDQRSTLAAGLRGALVSRPVVSQPSDQWVAFVRYVTQVPLLR